MNVFKRMTHTDGAESLGNVSLKKLEFCKGECEKNCKKKNLNDKAITPDKPLANDSPKDNGPNMYREIITFASLMTSHYIIFNTFVTINIIEKQPLLGACTVIVFWYSVALNIYRLINTEQNYKRYIQKQTCLIIILILTLTYIICEHWISKRSKIGV